MGEKTQMKTGRTSKWMG